MPFFRFRTSIPRRPETARGGFGDVFAGVVGPAVAGAGAGLVFAAMTLAADAEGLGRLIVRDASLAAYALWFLVPAAGFAVLAMATAIGSGSRGEPGGGEPVARRRLAQARITRGAGSRPR